MDYSKYQRTRLIKILFVSKLIHSFSEILELTNKDSQLALFGYRIAQVQKVALCGAWLVLATKPTIDSNIFIQNYTDGVMHIWILSHA